MISQRDAVIKYCVQVLKDRDVEYILGESEPIVTILTREDKDKIHVLISNGILNGEIDYASSMDSESVRKYIYGILVIHLRKVPGLNQNRKYDPRLALGQELIAYKKKFLEEYGEEAYLHFLKGRQKSEIELDEFVDFINSDFIENIVKSDNNIIYQLQYSEDLQDFKNKYSIQKENLEKWKNELTDSGLQSVKCSIYAIKLGGKKNLKDVIILIEKRLAHCGGILVLIDKRIDLLKKNGK